jgi:uncharacterized protein
MNEGFDDGGRLALWDWRRRMSAIYAEVREATDPEAGWRFWRAERDALCREHPQSPFEPEQRAEFSGLDYWDYDPEFRFAVELAAVDNAVSRTVETGTDGTMVMTPCARTEGLAGSLGRELTLYWIEGYGGGIFLPFRDASTGKTTYGGGRYLLDTLKGADLGSSGGGTVLDFNFAYNPSCAYSPRWVCPLAPPENTLPISIEAGERFG